VTQYIIFYTMMRSNNKHQREETGMRKSQKLLWNTQMFIGVIMLIVGMLCNGGNKKYIRVSTTKAFQHCQKLYVNVHAISQKETGAMICCNGTEDLYSYNGFLCSKKIKALPLIKTITRFPESWFLSLLPVILQLLIQSYTWIKNFMLNTTTIKNDCQNRVIRNSINRMIFYTVIMMFRGWCLYVYLNKIQNFLLNDSCQNDDNDWFGKSATCPKQSIQNNCWYAKFLKNTHSREFTNASCNDARQFDFSDHIVLFYAHSLPLLWCEVLFYVWSRNSTNVNAYARITNSMPQKKERGVVRLKTLDVMLSFIFNRVFYWCMFALLIYLNLITLLSAYSTAAYFHTIQEVFVGYLISLVVQIPLGFVACSERWSRLRHNLGLVSA